MRMLGQGCRMNSAGSTWGSELCPAQLPGVVTLLCGGAGSQECKVCCKAPPFICWLSLVLDRCCCMNQCSDISLCPQKGWDCQRVSFTHREVIYQSLMW